MTSITYRLTLLGFLILVSALTELLINSFSHVNKTEQTLFSVFFNERFLLQMKWI